MASGNDDGKDDIARKVEKGRAPGTSRKHGDAFRLGPAYEGDLPVLGRSEGNRSVVENPDSDVSVTGAQERLIATNICLGVDGHVDGRGPRIRNRFGP